MRPRPDLPDDGILLGYSLERERHPAPIGFVYGAEADGSAGGYLDPILMTGDGHLITIAPTGAGKGVSCIIPTLLRFRGPVIVVDPKGENYAVTAERRRALGQEVVLLDPLGITDADEVDALNPVDLIDPSHPQSIEDAAMLASLLTADIEKEDPRNAFWYQRGEQLTTGLIQHVAITESGRHRSLSRVREMLNLPVERLEELARSAMLDSPDPDVRIVGGIVTNPATEMTGSIMSMAQNSLEFLRGGLIEHATRRSTFDLAQVTAGAPLSIYIVIPPDKLESLRGLLRTWIGTLMSLLMRRRYAPPMRTLFILDEAAQLGSLDQLRQAVTLMRGYGLQTWSFWQDLSQLQNLYPRDWQTMCNNSRVQQAFGFMSQQAADAACDLVGFYDAHEILRLDSTEMLLSVAGDDAVIARKPNYLRDEAFQGLYDENPFYREVPEGPPEPRTPPRWYVRPTFPRTDEVEQIVEGPRTRLDVSRAQPGPFSPAASRVKGPEAPGWETVGGDERQRLVTELNRLLADPLPDDAAIGRVRLHCYPRHDLLRVVAEVEGDGDAGEGEGAPGDVSSAEAFAGPRRAYAFYAPGELVPLTWEAETIHDFNPGALQITQVEEARDYLRFFSWAIRGDEGRFFIAEGIPDLPLEPGGALAAEQRDALERLLHPVRSIEVPEEHSGSFGFLAPVLYDGDLFVARFRVSWRGFVTMTGDEPVELDLPVPGDDLDEGGYFTLERGAG